MRHLFAVFALTTLLACSSSNSGSLNNENASDDNAGNPMGDTTGDNSGNQTDTAVILPAVQPFAAELVDNGTGAGYSRAINSALLSGPMIGTNELPNSDVHKSISFIAENPSADFEILHATAYRSGFRGLMDEAGFVVVHLRNNSAEIQCGVTYRGSTTYDSNGQVLAGRFNTSPGAVQGSLAINSDGEHQDSCISPGEIVYIRIAPGLQAPYDLLEGIRIGEISGKPSIGVSTLAMVPISYEVNGDVVDVLVVNRSAETLDLFSSHVFVLSDEGVPIFTRFEIHDTELLSGDELVLSYPDSLLKGSASTIRVVLDYNPL